MCGHVGAAGSLGPKERQAFKEMLVCNSIRGVHATGIASVDWGGNAMIFKRAVDPWELMEFKAFDTVIGTSSRVLIGHGRHATTGSKGDNSNAHPFSFKHIIGAHNGTIPQYAHKRLNNEKYFDTDSEAIFADMEDELEVKDADYVQSVRKVVGKLDGAWALVMWMRKQKRLCFVRNKERTLFYVYSKDKTCLFWSSEVGLLLWILARNGIEIHDKPFVLTEDRLLSFEIPVYNQAFSNPTSIKCEGYTSKAHLSVQDIKNKTGVEAEQLPFDGGTRTGVGTTTTASSQKKTEDTTSGSKGSGSAVADPKPIAEVSYLARSVLDPTKGERNTKLFLPPYIDPKSGRAITKEDFNDMIAKTGECAYCNHTASWGEEMKLLLPNTAGRAQYLCKYCVADEQIMDICAGMM